MPHYQRHTVGNCRVTPTERVEGPVHSLWHSILSVPCGVVLPYIGEQGLPKRESNEKEEEIR